MVCGSHIPTTVSVYEQQRFHAFANMQYHCGNGHIFTVAAENKLDGASCVQACASAKAFRESECMIDDTSKSASDDGSPVSRLATLSVYNEDATCEIELHNNNGHELRNYVWFMPAVAAFSNGVGADDFFASMQVPTVQAAPLVAERCFTDPPTCMQESKVLSQEEGHNLAHELMRKLEAGGTARQEALSRIRGNMQELSFDPEGCRVVQLALKVADTESASDLVEELRGCIQDASQSPFANYVIQRIIEILPNAITGFVAEELLNSGCVVAKHRFGCRVLCRLLEHNAKHPSVLVLANKLVQDTLALARHEYGHYVMQSLVEHGSHMHQQQIATAFAEDFAARVEDGSCSYVLESMFLHCSGEALETLLRPLLFGGSFILDACTHSVCGIRVLRAVVKSQCGRSQQLHQRLMALSPQIRRCSQGHRLLQEVKQAKKQGGVWARFDTF